MSMKKRTFTDDDGAILDILDIDPPDGDSDYDTIRIRQDPTDNDNPIQVVGLKDDEVVYQSSFKKQDVELTAISSMNNEDCDDIPDEIQTAFNAVGFAVVPNGDWWRKP